MKNIGIIIHSRPAYDMQWDALLPNGTINNVLILIATAKSIEKLTKRDKKAFVAIYKSENFDYDHLKATFNTIHQTFYCNGDKTKVSTVAEYDMIVTAMLRDYFREQLSIDGPGLNAILPFRDKLMKPNLKTPSVLINPNLLPGPNPLKPLGCTTISYPTFFNKRNVGIGAVALLSQLTKTEANAHSPLLCTDVNPYLLFALIVGSGLFVAILLLSVWEIMPVENKARNPTV